MAWPPHRPPLGPRERLRAFHAELERLAQSDPAISLLNASAPNVALELVGIRFCDPQVEPGAHTVIITSRVHRYEDFSEVAIPLFEWLRRLPPRLRRKVIVEAYGADYGSFKIRRMVDPPPGVIIPDGKLIRPRARGVIDPNRFFNRQLVGPDAIEVIKHLLLGPNSEIDPASKPIPQDRVTYYDLHGSRNSAGQPKLFMIAAPRWRDSANTHGLDFFSEAMSQLSRHVPVLGQSRNHRYYRRYQRVQPGVFATPMSRDTSEKFAAEEAGIARSTTVEVPLGVPFPVGLAITAAGLATHIGVLIGVDGSHAPPAVEAINLALGSPSPFWTPAELEALGSVPDVAPADWLLPALRHEELWAAA